MAAILDAHLATGTAPNVALMALLIEAGSPDEARRWIDKRARAASQADADRLRTLTVLLDRHPAAWGTIRAVMAEADHAAAADPATWGAVFDRVAAVSPEAGAALYALGSPDLLRAATDEVAAFARRLGLLGPERDLLEIGCGWGRLTLTLAGEMRSALGLDVSPAMIAEARRRASGRPGLRFERTDGHGLVDVPDRSADLVLAADVFPYLVASSPALATQHVRDAARVLRPGGALLVLNYSYRGDDGLDAADVRSACEAAGLAAERIGTRDLRWWDARTYLARRPE